MATYDERLVIVEKDVAVIKRDITYKLDDTNSAVTIIKGVAGTIAQDVKVIKSQMKTMDIRLEGIDTHLVRLEEQQSVQGHDIKDVQRHLDTLDGKLEQVLQQLAILVKKPE